MTEVEALLSVDAGVIPDDTTAFFASDVDVGLMRFHLTLSVAAAVGAIACAVADAGRPAVLLMLIASAVFAVLAIPTKAEDVDPRMKKQVMVVTQTAIILREHAGLQTWRFADLAGVVASSFDGRPSIILIERGGRRHVIDYMRFQRAERAREVIAHQFRLQRAHG